jgi:hypothetical protein
MLRLDFVGLTVVVLAGATGRAQTTGCEVPDGLTATQKLSCIRAATLMLDQPLVDSTQITKGPDFNPARPDLNQFSFFTAESTLNCYFRPHYAFQKVPGDSMKFQCWQMAPNRGFYSKNGEVLVVDEVKAVIEKDKSGDKSASLYPRNDASNQHEVKAEHLKVKYLKPPFPNHNPRFNEVFTSVASARFLWVLGFPADHEYPAGAAACVGCSNDPFGDKLAVNNASVKDAPVTFKVVNVERELDWNEIGDGDDSTWSWNDAAKFYSQGWTREQKVQYDAYRLALGLIHYHNALPQQNRVDCAEWLKNDSKGNKTCQSPVIYVHDLGSTFGKKRSALDLFGTNPRGNFKAWEPQTVFVNASNCELRATLLGDKQVLKEAQDVMIHRVARLDRDTVKSIFRVARFNMVDQDQVRRLKSKDAENFDEAALDEWTDVMMQRIDEIRSARNCKTN